MTKHRYDAQRKTSVSLYHKFKELGADLFYIELIEEYPCNSKQELLAREGYYIRDRGTINKQIAGRSHKQYYQEHKEHYAEQGKQRYETNKDKILAQHKEYAERNKEHIAQKKKEYYETNKDKIAEYKKQWHVENQAHVLEKVRLWRENNKEKAKETHKQYYEKNKERISERDKANYETRLKKLQVMVRCECGLDCQKQSMRLHLRSKKHEELMEQTENPQE
jgi:hypothetical protein